MPPPGKGRGEWRAGPHRHEVSARTQELAGLQVEPAHVYTQLMHPLAGVYVLRAPHLLRDALVVVPPQPQRRRLDLGHLRPSTS